MPGLERPFALGHTVTTNAVTQALNIAALVSGGVDSAVALALTKARYPDAKITGYYLKIWLEDDVAFLGDCPWDEDLRYARAVCDQLGVPLKAVSLQGEYWRKVVDHSIAELKKGYTPSPDILCNSRIKFGAFLDKLGTSVDLVVSGHYATIKRGSAAGGDECGTAELWQGVDAIKDQSYFLSAMRQDQLARCEFPLGDMTKAEVRERAAELKLANAGRKDSQGICFLGKIKYNDFVRAYLGDRPGPIVVWETGEQVGRHQGVWYHTIGQRKGLGLSGGPWFVVYKNLATDTVYVSRDSASHDLTLATFKLGSCQWNGAQPALEPWRASNEGGSEFPFAAKIRHGPQKIPCRLRIDGDAVVVTLERPEKGIAPGQYGVIYQGARCLGSGIITEGLKPPTDRVLQRQAAALPT